MAEMISDTIITNRLIIADATMNECEILQKIGEGWDDKALLEGDPFESGYILRCIKEGDLPPISHASKKNYRLKSILLKESDTPIGFTDIYHGYPSDDTVWISLFVLDRRFHNNGFAKEAVEGIIHELRITGYKKIGVGVSLKNWKALRFWTRIGFDKVTEISGDENYGEKSFAVMKLEKNL